MQDMPYNGSAKRNSKIAPYWVRVITNREEIHGETIYPAMIEEA